MPPTRKRPATTDPTRPPHGLAGRTGPDANRTLAPGQARDTTQKFRCTAAEATDYATAAAAAGLTVSDWIRRTLRRATRRKP